MNTNIDCFKTIAIVSYCNKNVAGLCIRIKNFTLLSNNNQRLFSPVLHYELVATKDFDLIPFHRMISISDCLCKLRYIKC